jgi:aminoglycoside 6-adenylyltransferase
VRGPVERRLEGLTVYGERGVRLLVDKDGVGGRLLAALPAGGEVAVGPSAERFRAAVDEFWFLAVWTAKHLRRGELWAAKTVGVDGGMKALLVRMIAWHAGAVVSEEGRHLEEWADPAVVAQLGGVFAHYDENDLWRASFATMDLFRRLARETAERLGVPYDEAADRAVTEWVTRCEAERR